jgi:hypothetical protein
MADGVKADCGANLMEHSYGRRPDMTMPDELVAILAPMKKDIVAR